MRVLTLSWEYPPVVVGGLGRHVHALTRTLARQGHEVVVLSRQPAGTDPETHPTTDQVIDGVRVVRVAEDPLHLTFEDDLVPWTFAMGHAMTRTGVRLLGAWVPEVVHAHDWLVTHPAIALSETAGVPLAVTIHATEAGRHSGWLSHPHSRQIHSVEWWLVQHADALITCSVAMRNEVSQLFELAPETITVLRNGIEPRTWRVRDGDVHAARRAHGAPGNALLLYVGRLEWEKGVHDLLAALPRIRTKHPGTVAAIAGTGSRHRWLLEQAVEHGVSGAAVFTGQLPDRELAALISAADAVVLPSRYEPFGMVALETAAAGTPLIASAAGGLNELVHHGQTGLAFAPGDVEELAAAVDQVLTDPKAAARRAEAAKTLLDDAFNWDSIAARTALLYATTGRHNRPPLPRPKIATGNVLGH